MLQGDDIARALEGVACRARHGASPARRGMQCLTVVQIIKVTRKATDQRSAASAGQRPSPAALQSGRIAHVCHYARSRQQELGRHARRGRRDSHSRGRLAAGAAGAFRLRQVHDAASDRRTGSTGQWHGVDRRGRCHAPDAGAAQDIDGVSVLCAVPPSERRGEHRVRPARARRLACRA